MAVDVSNDVASTDANVEGGHMSLSFSFFRGQMGPFPGDTWQ